MGLSILTLISRLRQKSGRSWSEIIRYLSQFIRKLLANPQIAELWRFIFLGTIVETGKIAGQKVVEWVSGFFVIKATFTSSEFAYDWVKHYLDSHRVWDESRSFKVVSRNTEHVPPHAAKSELGLRDGHPDPVYEPAPQAPELFRWKGHWISVSKNTEGYAHHTNGTEIGGVLVLTVWSRDRKVLDDFVLAARDYYINSTVPPVPRKLEANEDTSGSILIATFTQGDWSYDWMLSYLRSENALKDVIAFTITTKQSDVGWSNVNTGNKKDTGKEKVDVEEKFSNTFPKSDLVRYLPASDAKQMFLYTSPKSGQRVWMQVTLINGLPDYRGNTIGGSIKIIVHTSHKPMLAEIIESARQAYMASSSSRVVLHMTDNYGSWAKTITKSRRKLHTVVLPSLVKENLLKDLQEFLGSERWYVSAGVPHRRGYLLYGDPGTGKSSTIHAMAGELGLEIYCISLASPGIDDHTLLKLISDTPSRCILLLEDIDCAFPSRSEDGDVDEEVRYDRNGKRMPPGLVPPKSNVTLSGLLNMLDSVSSEEGRITFATTNHIENLDPALIRAGRMDVKIHYKLTTPEQAEQVFLRFYPFDAYAKPNIELSEDLTPADSATNTSSPTLGAPAFPAPRLPHLTSVEITTLAQRFSEQIPGDTFSVAQLQGYLLTKKFDPVGAVEGVKGWLDEQAEEKRAAEEKRRKRLERMRAMMAEEEGGPARDAPKEAVEETKPESVKEKATPGDVPSEAGKVEDASEEVDKVDNTLTDGVQGTLTADEPQP